MDDKLISGDIINFANYIPGGLFIFSIKNQYPYVNIKMWNKRMVEITGYKLGEFDENVFLSILGVKEEALKSNETSIEDIIQCDKKTQYEIISKDGTKKILDIYMAAIRYEDEKHTIIATVKDVTVEKMKERERELKEIEQRYKKIIDNSTDAIIIYGSFKILYANEKLLNLIDCESYEDIIGQHVFKIVHPDYYEIVEERIKESREKEGSVQLIEEKFVTSKGNVIDVEVQMTCIPYDGKKCNVAFIRDITERKQMEYKLKKSEKYFKKLFNNVSDAVYLNRIEENGLPSVYIDVNNVACSRVGYTREEFRKMTVFETTDNLSRDKVLKVVKEVTEKGKIIYEGFAKKKNGEITPVEINSIFLVLDNDNYILSISRDISERKKNEEELKDRERRYRHLVEALPYGVYMWSKQRLVFCNKVGLVYAGVTDLEKIKGEKYNKILCPHPSYMKKYKKNIKYVLENGYMPLTEEKFIRYSDKKNIDLETIITKYPYGEVDDTYLVVTRDISDRKKAEALQQDMDEKTKQLEQVANYERLRTEFFANISHELRTPVNVIFSALQLINYNMNNVEDRLSELELYKKHIDIMKQNCFRLVRLINNLIDVTKIDSGYFNLNLINTNIISIVEEITQSVAAYISNKGVSLIFDTEVEEKTMACDPEKIERIMLNLISNAVKFTPPGGTLFVNIKDNGSHIVISVKDTGIGIPKDKQTMIFERFIQVDKSLARNKEGSGIGLSLVRSLVEMHKGTICVQSEENEGSEFFIDLPVYMVEEDDNMVTSAKYMIQDNVEKINVEFSDIYF